MDAQPLQGHTPGPWTATRDVSTRWHVVAGSDAFPVAELALEAEGEANARLIAAAPDLLAQNAALIQQRDALRTALRDVLGCTVRNSAPDAGTKIKAAWAALALPDPEGTP